MQDDCDNGMPVAIASRVGMEASSIDILKCASPNLVSASPASLRLQQSSFSSSARQVRPFAFRLQYLSFQHALVLDPA